MAKDQTNAPGPVRGVVHHLKQHAQGPQVQLGQLVSTCGDASFVPALAVPALLVVSPLSGVPLFSSLCGLTIALIAGQMVWRRSHLYLPEVLATRHVDGDKVRGGLERIEGLAAWLDRHTQAGRLGMLAGRRSSIVPQSLSVVAGAAMPFLEIVPFSSSILGMAVLCFAVGMLTRDGVFVAFGLLIMAAVATLAFFVLQGFF